MEDAQDKVRRNLVAFSAAIIIGWFLDLKLSVITKQFVSTTELNNVDVGKLWIVAFVALIYFFLRYKFDTTTSSQILHLSNELGVLRKRYRSKYIFRKISKINRTGNLISIFGASLAEGVSQEIKKLKEEHCHAITLRLHISNPWNDLSPNELDDSNSIWEGEVGIAEVYLKTGSSRNLVVSSGQMHKFSIPLSGRIWVSSHSIIHVVSYSKSAVDLLIPMVLSGFALFIVVRNFVTIYLL